MNGMNENEEKEIFEEEAGFNSNDLEVNRKNSEQFESLMRDASVNLDFYWDKNNIFVKFILLGLGLFIIVGVIMVLFL